MGLSCSKSKAGRDVLRSRADTLSRGQMAQPSSLAELCISALADHHERLCATDIEQRIGTNVAQRLLNALIQRGKLNHAVAAMFASAHLWQVELPNHPGIGSDLFELLSSGSLTVIDLSGTQVDDLAMRTISKNTHLHTLNLSNTCVTSDGLASLCFNPHLSKLELNGCKQLSQSIPALRSLSNLQHVSLSQSRFLSPCHVISALKNATKMTYLDLSWCQGSAGSARRALLTLPQLQQLRVLHLDNACLPVEVFACVLLLPRISRLGACGYAFPPVSDIPLALLTKIFRVRPASMAGQAALITSAGPGYVQGNTRLAVYASPTADLASAAHTGAQSCSETVTKPLLADGRSLATLKAGIPPYSPSDILDDPILPMCTPALLLPRMHSLTSLHLRWANVSSQAWNLLALLPNLQRLDAAFTNAKNDTVRTLSPLRTLTSLNLDSTFVTDQGMRFISSFSALQYLNLSDTKLGNPGLDNLHSLRKLDSLNLSYTNITDPGVALLTVLTTLTCLSVDSRLISDSGVVHLTSLTRLRALDLFGCKLTRAGAGHVAKLPQLQWLEAAGGVLCDEGLRKLQCLTALTYLSIAQNRQVTDSAMASLISLSLLRQLNISGTSITLEKVATLINHMVFIETLAVHGLQRSKAQALRLKHMFPRIGWTGLQVTTY